MNRILVTGGAGYIGGHVCKRLAQAGFSPVAFDSLELGHRDFVRWGPLVEADLRTPGAVEQALRAHRIDAVMHFAALAYVGESVSDPGRYYDNNVGGTLALLQGMRAAGVDRLVFSSTCAIYGDPESPLIAEDSPKSPVNPYGRTKLVCEGMIEDFGSAHGLRAVRLRYFNAAGADPDGELGERRDPETHLIPRALMSLLGWIDDFQVFGVDFPTPDGTAVRDYIHVSDLADAHLLALEALLGGAGGGAFNLGTGSGLSVAQVLEAVRRVTGQDLPAPRGPRRPGDPARLVADPSLAKAALSFQPRRSDVDTIVASAWRWHQRAHPERQRA